MFVALVAVAAALGMSYAMAGDDPCYNVSKPQPPKNDMPAPADRDRLRGCNSEALYYGLGMPADPKDARLCAFVEIEHGAVELPLEGSGMLMMIYANGAQVQRNLSLAKSYACTLGWDSRDLETLMRRMEAVRKSGGVLDACDVAPAGTILDICSAHREAVRLARIDDEEQQIVSHWPATRRDAFARLKKAETAYESARSTTETTLRDSPALQTSRRGDFRREFTASLKAMDAPVDPSLDLGQLDRELNAKYRAILKILVDAQAESPDRYGSLTPDGLRSAERAWLHYADAWEEFRATAALPLSTAELRRMLTMQRVVALRRLLAQLQDAG